MQSPCLPVLFRFFFSLAALISTCLADGAWQSNASECDDGDSVCALQHQPKLSSKLDADEAVAMTQGEAGNESANYDFMGEGADVALNIIETAKGMADSDTFNVQSASSVLKTMSGIVSFAVPPPAGLIAGPVLGFVGGVFGLFGKDEPEPSNQDVIDAMNAGFDQLNERLDDIDMKLDGISGQLSEIQKELVVHLDLKSDTISEITRDYQIVDEHRARSNVSQTELDLYKESLQRYRLQHENEKENPDGAVSSSNVNKTMALLNKEQSLKSICEAGDFFKQIIAARFELYHIIMMDDYFQAERSDTNASQRMKDRGLSANFHLEDLHKDLEAFNVSAFTQGGEARLRWELGDGENCKKPCLATTCALVSSREGLCAAFNGNTVVDEGEQMELDTCKNHDPQMIGDYRDHAMVHPEDRIVTNNPRGYFSHPALCLTFEEPAGRWHAANNASIWKPCDQIPSEQLVIADNSTYGDFKLKTVFKGLTQCMYVAEGNGQTPFRPRLASCDDERVKEYGSWKMEDLPLSH